MKKVSLPLLLIFSFSLLAQDDYCPCQDEQAQENEIFEYFSSVNTQMAVFVPAENNNSFIPASFDEPEPVQIVIPQKEEEDPVENIDEVDPEESEEKIESRISTDRSHFKKIKKRKRVKLKRKKKARKYKGKCPFF